MICPRPAATLAGALLGLLPAAVPAVMIVTSEIEHSQNHYRVAFEVLIAAPAQDVRARMIDYANLDKLSPLVVESRVLATIPGGGQRLELIMRGCVWFFCKTAKRVTDVTVAENGDIHSRALPELSDFSQADEVWRITPEQGRTRIRYNADIVPKFFVPPLIGPPILKYKLRDELETLSARLEDALRP